MKTFTFHKPTELQEASKLLKNVGQGHLLAGGTDLVTEMKQGVIEPNLLISASDIKDMSGMVWNNSGLTIGSMVTLDEIASDADIGSRIKSLAEAATSIATPQIRNIATLGGNLCQRPRCWYYRNVRFNCLKKGGEKCFAVGGSDKYNAILGGSSCYIVHPSDSATALVALKAKVEIFRDLQRITIPIDDFFAGPEVDVTRENILEPGDILISVQIPKESMDGKSVYLKAKERQSMDFAIASVAVMVKMEKGLITEAGIAAGGVAPIPWHLSSAEGKLIGYCVEDIDVKAISSEAFADAKILGQNGYKLQLVQTYLERALNLVLR
ncbi:MAG: xanthine dehydrogenase family protein subunit M [SAR202 cluster bacterium]|nr:xanthine dehydrogenase family protein subunit M [SAR202 cluster bacterium]